VKLLQTKPAGCTVSYRGTDTFTAPGVAFLVGILPKGKNRDLQTHVLIGSSSLFVSTSRLITVAETYPRNPPAILGYVYKIVSKRGVDVNMSFGPSWLHYETYAGDNEIAIPFGIKPSEIEGRYEKVNNKVVPTSFVPNPMFAPDCTP
jgi:hypothetical protein